MKFLDQISVLILTFNEACNIGRTLERLSAFSEIIVLDSGSDDGTETIVGHFPNARLIIRPFDTHANQWNFGITQCTTTRPWVLALDADYLVSESFVAEIEQLSPSAEVTGYQTSFRYCLFGRPLYGNLYPPVVTLFRRDRAYYAQSGHTQRLIIDGTVAKLIAKIDHDDRKPLSRWLTAQLRYASLEAEHLLTTPKNVLRRSDIVRLMGGPAPVLVFIYTLFLKRCILNGWRGWFYVLQRTFVEIIIALEILDRRRAERDDRAL